MSRRRRESRAARDDRPVPGRAESVRQWLLAGTVALHVVWPLLPSEAVGWAGDGVLTIAVWLALGGLWSLAAWYWPELAPRITRVDAALLVLWVLYSVSCGVGFLRAAPRPALNLFAAATALGWSYWLPRQLLRSSREARALLAVLIAMACGCAAVGCSQFFVTLPDTRDFYAADPDRALADADLWFPPDSRERFLYEQRLASLEPFGTFALANSLGGFLAPWLVLGSSVALSRFTSSYRRGWRDALLLIALSLVALCLVLTKSRSAMLAALAGATAVGWISLRRIGGLTARRMTIGAAFAAIALVALVVVGFATGGLDRQFLSEAPKSLGYRGQYWQATLGIIADDPLFGCGPGSFEDAYTRYKLPAASEEIKDPHNFLLEIASTAGTPSALALLAAVGLALVPWQRAAGDIESLDSMDTRSIAPIWLGAAAGLPLAMILQAANTAPLAIADVMLVAVVGGLAVVALAPWVSSGRIPVGALRIAIAVLLLNLSIAGGIGFPGVAATLWLLIAIVVAAQSDESHPVAMPLGFARWLWPIVAGSLLVLIEATSVVPVLRCRTKLLEADMKRADAVAHFESAALADRWSFEPWQQLARSYSTEPPTEDTRRKFAAAAERLIGTRPQSSLASSQAGHGYLTLYEKQRQPKLLEQAERMLRHAAELYPTSAAPWVDVARVSVIAGNNERARDAAIRAVNLDEQTPHVDAKLSDEARSEMRRIAER